MAKQQPVRKIIKLKAFKVKKLKIKLPTLKQYRVSKFK